MHSFEREGKKSCNSAMLDRGKKARKQKATTAYLQASISANKPGKASVPSRVSSGIVIWRRLTARPTRPAASRHDGGFITDGLTSRAKAPPQRGSTNNSQAPQESLTCRQCIRSNGAGKRGRGSSSFLAAEAARSSCS